MAGSVITGEDMSVYKAVFCGSPNMGKTKMVKEITKIKNREIGEQETIVSTLWNSFASTLGVEVTPYVFSLENRFVNFNIWDCGSTHRGMGKAYFKDCDVAFIFTRPDEEIIRQMYINELHEMAPNVVIYHVDETDTIDDVNYGLVLFATS